MGVPSFAVSHGSESLSFKQLFKMAILSLLKKLIALYNINQDQEHMPYAPVSKYCLEMIDQ